MTRTPTEYIAWVKAHKSRHQGGPWATSGVSFCEQLVNNAGGFSEAFATAALAGSASGKLDKNRDNIQVGEFVYWTNHVGLYVGDGKMLCASTIFAGNGSGTGTVKLTDWEKHFPSQKWRGHTRRHGTQTLAEPKPTASQRVVGAIGANVREDWTRKDPATEVLAPGSIQDVLGWRHGEKATSGGITTDVWYSLKVGWIWAGGCTFQSTDGLKDLNPVVVPVTDPPVDVLPVEATVEDPLVNDAPATTNDPPPTAPAAEAGEPPAKPPLPGGVWASIIVGILTLLGVALAAINGGH